MSKSTVYVFRGAPASGKGTLVPAFCKLLPQPVVLIEQDKFRWGLHLIGRNIPDVSDAEHVFAHRNTMLIYEQYLKNGNYTIVVEGLFTWNDQMSSQGSVKELIDMAQSYGYACKSFVLRADKDRLLARNAAREYSVPAGEFETLHRNIYAAVDAKETVIDSTEQSSDQTLARLREFI